MLDKLSEKIDYMFRRGKNADERCFDFFLRSVTFFIILLAVLTYGGLVHASTEIDTNDYDTMNQDYFFTYTELNNHYDGSNAANVYPTINQGFLGSYPALWSENRIVNFESQISGISLNNESSIIDSDYKKYFALFLQLDTGTSEGLCRCNLISIYSKDIPLIINDGSTVFNSSLDHWYIYSEYPYVINNTDFQINYANQYLPFQLKGNTKTEVSEGGLHNINGSVSSYLFGCDCNIYSLMYSNIYSGSTSSTKLYTSISDMVSAIYNDSVTDKPFNLNPYSDLINPVIPDPVESDDNNLYLDDVQIGLTSTQNGQDLLSSEVVIGVSTEDDYILNHLDNFELNVDFQLHIKDTFASSPNDPTTNYSISFPLRAFLNEPVIVSLFDIMKNSEFPSGSTYSNFYQYYNALILANNYTVKSSNTFKGIIPTIFNGARGLYDILFGTYSLNPVNVSNNAPTIFDFSLDVICWLTSSNTSEESGNYNKHFNFLNGTESIKSAGLLQNYNPWEGTQEPTASPLIPAVGSSVGSYGGGNNTQVNVEVSGQKVPIGVKTRAEIETILNNYKEVNDNFMDQWEDLSDPNNNNNFIKFLNQETRQLPAVDYLITGACCIFGLSIILFILKVLLF